jgi:hypothetical protein
MEGARIAVRDSDCKALILSHRRRTRTKTQRTTTFHNLSWTRRRFSVKISSALLTLVLDSAADGRKLVLPPAARQPPHETEIPLVTLSSPTLHLQHYISICRRRYTVHTHFTEAKRYQLWKWYNPDRLPPALLPNEVYFSSGNPAFPQH